MSRPQPPQNGPSDRRRAAYSIGDLIEHSLGNEIGRWALPVVWVDVQPDADIAHGLRDLYRHDLVTRGWFGISKKGSAEQSHRATGESLEQALCRVDLERNQRSR